MAGNADVLRQVVDLLSQHASVRERVRGSEPIGLSRRPNAPRFVTVVAALALTVVGIAVNLHQIKPITDLLANANVELTKQQGWLALLASPALLIIGSFFRGI
jgi:hypothetical protein